MNILLVSPFVPYPPNQGGKIRVLKILEHLSKRHRVTLACLSGEETFDCEPLRRYCAEIVVVRRKPNPVTDLFFFLLSHQPYNWRRFVSHEFRKALRELAERGSFDLVQIEFTLLWQYADVFDGIPVTLSTHNVEYEIIKQLRGQRISLVRRVLYFLELNKLKYKEEQAWRECRLCFTVSDRERDIITASVGDRSKVVLVPNGVDLERVPFVAKTNADRRLLHLGGMDYTPNLDSAQYFLREIWPLTRRKVPDLALDVVGRELWRVRQCGLLSGVAFHENVPEVLPFLRNSDVLVVPLRMGAGTRLKIIEAMAAGLPVVSTTKGCEGLGVVNGTHLVVADEPEAFSDAVVRILNDPLFRARLVKNARALVENKFSWPIVLDNMEVALNRLVSGPVGERGGSI